MKCQRIGFAFTLSTSSVFIHTRCLILFAVAYWHASESGYKLLLGNFVFSFNSNLFQIFLISWQCLFFFFKELFLRKDRQFYFPSCGCSEPDPFSLSCWWAAFINKNSEKASKAHIANWIINLQTLADKWLDNCQMQTILDLVKFWYIAFL